MKNLKAPFLAFALILFNILIVSATPAPPAPNAASTAKSSAVASDCEICPDDFPINENIVFLVISGLALGATVIYRNQTKKASI